MGDERHLTTVKDIAKLANVSVATVSRVLNHTGRVGAETRARVEQIMDEVNFVPNQVARSLYQKKSNLIGVIIPDLENPFYGQIATSIEDELANNGYQVMLSVNTHDDINKYNQSITNFIQNNVSGIISSNFVLRTNLEIPLVLFDAEGTNNSPLRLSSNSRQGGKLAAKALIDGGAKNIVIQHGPLDLANSHARLDGALEVLEHSQCQYHLFEVTDFNYQTAIDQAPKLFDQYHDFDGIIAGNDIHAAALMAAARQRKLSIPKDFQIVGYDNSFISEITNPPLTSVSQSPSTIGKQAALLLLAALSGKTTAKEIINPVKLIKRSTTY